MPSTPANSINVTDARGIVGFDGTASFPTNALTQHSLLLGGANASTINNLGVATNGQIPIGSTGLDPVLATLTAGAGISIANAAGSITITNTGGGGGGVIQIDGDTGSATGSTITFDANTNGGSSVLFNASGSTVNLLVTDSNDNTIVGLNAGNATMGTAGTNTGVGANVLQSLVGTGGADANDNTAIGYSALYTNITGNANVAVGSSAMFLSTGNQNVAVGYSALTNGTGNSNTVVGNAGFQNLLTGSTNIGVGPFVGNSYTSSESSNILIGNAGVVGESNTIRIGDNGTGVGQQDNCYIAGLVTAVSGKISASAGIVNGVTQIFVNNTDTTNANSSARFYARTAVGGGDSYIAFDNAGAVSYLLGTQRTSTNLVITTGYNPATPLINGTNLFTLTPAGSAYFPGITGITTANTKYVTVDSTNGQLGATTSIITRVIRQVFTSSGTYTPTTGMLYADIEVVGAGGGGGGVPITAGNVAAAGGGGGAGGYARTIFDAATIGASKAITVGTGGAGGATGTGSTGGDSYVGLIGSPLIRANGGTGGTSATSGTNQFIVANGGTGGTTAGTVQFGYTGAVGKTGIAFRSTATQNYGYGGYGGSTYGTGADGGTFHTGVNIGAVGANAVAYGNGGGGASSVTNTTSAYTGGNGSSGIVIITEYCS